MIYSARELIAFAVFAIIIVALFAVVIRFGPPRGRAFQPAAAFQPAGRGLQITLLAVAALHLLAGIVLFVHPPYGGGVFWSGLIIGAVLAAFYAGAAFVWTIGTGLSSRVRSH